MIKKMGALTVPRPAFMDRDVNGATPCLTRKTANVKEYAAFIEDLELYDGCSYKDLSESEDLKPDLKTAIHMLRRYCNRDGRVTPPPKFDNFDDSFTNLIDCENNFNDFEEFPKGETSVTFLEVSIDDVDVPLVDFD